MSSDTDKANQYQIADDSVKIEDEVPRQLHQKVPSDAGKDSIMKSTNDDVQRAIEGLKDIPDEELQEFLDDEDFMEGLDVVDAWEGDEERNRDADKTHAKEGDQRRPSRERRRELKRSYSRERPKREERKREEIRRDPTKSTKDIERDKIRTKRDTESKLLAEKEKAIKHLLDSDDVVPPGTEAEAIQKSITEKQNLERAQRRIRRSRERRKTLEHQKGSPLRRRSTDRNRLSPHRRRSPLLLSPDRRRSPFKMGIERHRSPFRLSPDKRRSPGRYNVDRRSPFMLSPEQRRSALRRLSWERRSSADRRWSTERHRRRQDMHERRRSRSRDRQRSRSTERFRRRLSRSPVNRRFSPRRRSRTRSRSPDRRTRKRSPFINELARQLRNEAMMPPHVNSGYQPASNMEGIPPLMMVMNAPPIYQQDPESIQPHMPPPFMSQSGPVIPPPPPSSPPPPPPPPPPPSGGVSMTNNMPQFLNFDMPPQPMPFEPMPMHTLPPPDYSSGPVMYNQQNPGQMQPVLRPPLLPAPVPSPQPVPAPVPMDHGSLAYPSSHGMPSVKNSPPSTQRQHHESHTKPTNSASQPSSSSSSSSSSSFLHSYRDHKSSSAHNGNQPSHKERLKTPEPPVISNSKQFEKTSLSSLLEASVSAKDSTDLPILYPGFKPELLRHCEHALRELPVGDPRLRMKGRFFFDPLREDTKSERDELSSNSILLQKGKSRIYWQEEEEQHMSAIKPNVQMHQKICQTEETETDVKSVQATVTMVDRDVQVYPHDLQQTSKEDKKPIMDRLDWNMRETFDYTVKYREADDLRWSLSNSSQKRSWTRGGLLPSPRRSDDHEHRIEPLPPADHSSRNMKIDSAHRSRESYPSHKASVREHYGRERCSPGFRHSAEEHDDFPENRSDRSRGESPMVLEDSGDEIEPEHTFQRGSDWHGRGKSMRGKSNSLSKIHFPVRGKHLGGGRPYRGRGSFRVKF